MHSLLLFALTMQVKVGAELKPVSADSARASVRAIADTTRPPRERYRQREPKRVPVTEAHLRTAFRSPAGAFMLSRARAARVAQDSALMSYDATAYLRISAGIGFSKLGRDRLAFRHENVTRVRWHRDVGAWIDVKGARTAIPAAPKAEVESEAESMLDDSDMTPVPYYPGQEPLLSLNGGGMVKSQVDERDMVHPLAEGAEAYYTYDVGDSVVFRLPDGRSIQLRELTVRPRESKWNVVVGSLWFDASTGQLVRAAYRLAVPMDVWAIAKEEDPDAQEDIPKWVLPMISPMRAQITSIGVEYGLYQGRFWLPRVRTADGNAQVSFMRVPFTFQQSFRYASVNAIDGLPPIQIVQAPEAPDSLSPEQREAWRDSVRQVRRERRQALRDSIRDGLRPPIPRCDSTGTRLVTSRRRDMNLSVAMRIPCDLAALASSPDLPKSIFDDGEEIFGSAELALLKKEALAMGAQPPMAFGSIPPTLRWGLEFTRFNRIEGFSTAGLVEQPLGGGYTASLLGRLGHADLEPNAEVALARTNMSRVIRARAYNRLVAANDWGNPLSFGSSVSALLFGRDEGFYYRASGVEVQWARDDRAAWSWKAFAERQRGADVENSFSLGSRFIPNMTVSAGGFAGAAARFLHSRGMDPNGFRVFSDVRLESAMRDSGGTLYGRGAVDLTVTQALGALAAAVTLSGGTSAGELPPQRRWYLGGAHTVRGQIADTAQSGNAYWLGRLELGGPVRGARPVVFGDIGWVGSRERWSAVGRPLSGVGIGASVLDGLIRTDISRGLYPRKATRLDLYVEARF